MLPFIFISTNNILIMPVYLMFCFSKVPTFTSVMYFDPQNFSTYTSHFKCFKMF